MIKLTCPSCNGAMEIPDGLGVAHCMYCGTKILIDQSEAAKNAQSIKRYKELCAVAVQAKNHQEVIQYCNSILELDPRDVAAWIDKARSTFLLSTGLKNRYDEAIGYLKRALQLSPGDIRVYTARDEFAALQSVFYNQMGMNHYNHALKVWNIYARTNPQAGYTQIREPLLAAMEQFLRASDYAPANETILDNISRCRMLNPSLPWSEKVRGKMIVGLSIKKKRDAEEKLPELRRTLAYEMKELERLRQYKGLFDALRIRGVEETVQATKDEIEEKERLASFAAPKVEFDW